MDLDGGLFDFQEVAHLLGVTDQTVARICLGDGVDVPLVPPAHGWALSFGDLVAASVVVALRRRDVTYSTLRGLKRLLASQTRVSQPFSHQQALRIMGTAGNDVVADVGDGWESMPSRQLTLREPVEVYLEQIQFGPDGFATLWVPYERVVLDPEVQAGSPCVEGTRFETLEVFDLVEQGYAAEDIARDFELELAGVESAVRFEQYLADHVGIHAIHAAALR